MANEQWQKVGEIFNAARRQTPELRQNYLNQVCGENKTLLDEVESLLASHDSSDSFLETPAIARVTETLENKGQKLKKGKCFGNYEIIKQIGTGGMGEVYLAQDNKLDRQVAVKILNENFSKHESNLTRFIQEAKAASALNHPNILVIHEIGESEQTHYLVSEFIKGKTLREVLQDENLKLSEILDISIQIANALTAAHEARLAHRDIKPENIMIRPDGFVKVLDFGLAKLVEQKNKSILGLKDSTLKGNQTAEGVILGTINYMSPEQAKGKRVDMRTDIFSLGVVIYEMIAGQTPFAGDSMSETFANLLNAEPQPLSHFAANIPSELQRIVSKMLRKNKDERYQTMKGLSMDLKSLQKRLEFEYETKHSETPKKGHREQVNEKTELIADFGKIKSDTEKQNKIEIQNIPPNNLSIQITKLVGREKEIAKIIELLRYDDVRLITITGIGGMGKTRLAKEVASEVLSYFMDGVFFIDLAGLTNIKLVALTIAQLLGVKESDGKPIIEMLKDYLREKRILLVVDNFEQIVDAAPQIDELLSATKNLKILITSRILLRLTVEREFVVPPLSLPNKTVQVLPNELLKYEAIRLFVERAQGAKPKFALTEENSQSVAEICLQLDGLPLAIELAAARVKILSPQAILVKLENRLQLLTGGGCDLPTRQQTMRNTLEWSYNLLTEDEKRLFRSLSVFMDGFMFEAAEVICLNNELNESPIEVLDLITSLLDKSLIVSKERQDGSMRFRMLEVVREYGLEALETNGEMNEMRRIHAEYFLALGEEAEPHLQAADAAKWLNNLEEDHDNLRVAIHWLFENDTEMAARLAAAIRIYLVNHSHLTEGREWLNLALERSDGLPVVVRFKLLNVLGWLALSQGDYIAAWKLHKENLEESRTANDKKRIAESLRAWAQ